MNRTRFILRKWKAAKRKADTAAQTGANVAVHKAPANDDTGAQDRQRAA